MERIRFAPLAVLISLAITACARHEESKSADAAAGPPTGIAYEANVPAGGVVPPAGGTIKSPALTADFAQAGAGLFGNMNCDGCHGGGALGWVGPSLVDGRWRYGGAPEEIFSSIYYGRPKGMPAYGGVLGADGAWMIVAYLKSQSVPTVVPTTNYEESGSTAPAAAAPPPAASAAADAIPATPEQMLTKYGCTACHATDHKVVGPAFADVATKYHGNAGALAQLTEKVRAGGAGVWGDIPMSPNPQVPDADLQSVVKWVLALK
jgi:cytochrome c